VKYSHLAAGFNPEEWFSPETYKDNFAPLPFGPGIYLFCQIDWNPKPVIFRPLYVGMSRNIALRCRGHEIKSLLPDDEYIRTYFQPHNENLREIERQYIRAYNPPFNIIHRPRGI
jgi:excinuclease UvrABC nuclease subunit